MLLVLASAFLAAWGESRRWGGIDYYQFWVVGRAVAGGEAGDVYSDAERARLGEAYWKAAQRELAAVQVPGADPAALEGPGLRFQAARMRQKLETYSTPFLYTLVGLAATGDYFADQERFHHASLIVFALAIFALARRAGFPPLASALALAAFLLVFAPFSSDVRVGNVNRLLLGFVALALWLRSGARWRMRQVLAGFVLGCAAMFKPNLAFVLAALGAGDLARRRWRELFQLALGVALGALFAFGVSSAYFGGTGAWTSWAREVPELMEQYDHALVRGNFALSRLLRETRSLGDQPLVYLAVLVALFVAILFLSRRAGRRELEGGAAPERADAEWDVLLAGAGGALSLLTAQLAWIHYFLLAIPLALYLLRPRPEKAERGTALLRRVAALGATLCVGSRSLAGFSEAGPRGAALVSGGTLVLFLLAASDAPRAAPRHVR